MKKINSVCIIDDDEIMVYRIKKMLGSVVDCENIFTFGNGLLALEGIREMIKTKKFPVSYF
jgi:hypothetical protein